MRDQYRVLAFQYAWLRPDKLERLVIVDIAPETSSSGARRIMDGLRNKDIFRDPEEAFEAARRANPRPPDDELRGRTRFGLKQLEDGTWTFHCDVALRNGSGARVMPTPEEVQATWDSLQNITCPTLLVRGSDSDIFSPELAQRMLQSIPDCRLEEVPNSGHSVPLDNPTGFIQGVRTFL